MLLLNYVKMVLKHRLVPKVNSMGMMVKLHQLDLEILKVRKKNVIHRVMKIPQEMKEIGRIHILKHHHQWDQIVNLIDNMLENLQNH